MHLKQQRCSEKSRSWAACGSQTSAMRSIFTQCSVSNGAQKNPWQGLGFPLLFSLGAGASPAFPVRPRRRLWSHHRLPQAPADWELPPLLSKICSSPRNPLFPCPLLQGARQLCLMKALPMVCTGHGMADGQDMGIPAGRLHGCTPEKWMNVCGWLPSAPCADGGYMAAPTQGWKG